MLNYKNIGVFMEQKTRLDKTAYVMLTVSGILALLCITGVLAASIYGFVVASGDSNGGGWLFLLIFMAGIYFLPIIVSWVVQVILYIKGLGRYRKGNLSSARTFGIINCIVAILGNICLIVEEVLILMSATDWPVGMYVLLLFFGIGIVFMFITLVLLIISKNKNKLAQN